jgi:hypothetical protein
LIIALSTTVLVKASKENFTRPWDSKPEQKGIVDMILAHGDITTYISAENSKGHGHGISREAIKKRLQRARKFLLIVELFGTTVLNAAPEVSVSRLDGIGLQILVGFAREGVDSTEISAVRRNIGLARCEDP